MRSDSNRVFGVKQNERNPLYVVKNLIESHIEVLEEVTNPDKRNANPVYRVRNIFRKPVEEINQVLEAIRELNRVAVNSVRTAPIQEPAHERIKVRPILEQVVKACKSQHYLEHVMFVMSIPNDLPEVEADPIDLEEIFYNFLINAVQAAPENGCLAVDATYISKVKPEIVIAFRDTGQGIPEDVLPYIFEPFFTKCEGEGGIGFGLYIVKQLAERNKGRVTVESAPSWGSIFRLFLPVAGYA